MAQLIIQPNTSYPKFDSSDPAYVRGFTVVITEPNTRAGLSYAYLIPPNTYSDSSTRGIVPQYGSRNGLITVNENYSASFPEEAAKKWTWAFKDAIADYIDRGILLAFEDMTPLTADQVRMYA